MPLVERPYAYLGSHVLPETHHYRDGHVDCAWLHKFVRHAREHPESLRDPEGVEPWLRLTVRDNMDDAVNVILDREQVALMVERLTEWLDATKDN